jgi:hypothetical protein
MSPKLVAKPCELSPVLVPVAANEDVSEVKSAALLHSWDGYSPGFDR